MQSLLFIYETFSSGYWNGALILFDTVCVFAAISVIISKNPIVSVLFLIGLFLGVSCHLITSGISFIGLSYLLVYVGAVSILFLFILMLINIRISELLSDTSNLISLALIIALLFNYPIYEILPHKFYGQSTNNIMMYKTSLYENANNAMYEFSTYGFGVKNIFFMSSKLWDGSLAETTHISSIGDIMYTSYSVWLIITSVILLLAMVGAIVITIKQSKLSQMQY